MAKSDGENEDLRRRLVESAGLMEELIRDRGLLVGIDAELRERFMIAAGRVSRPSKQQRKALARARQRVQVNDRKRSDRALLQQTGIRKLRESPIFLTPRRQALFDGRTPDTAAPWLGQTDAEKICYVCRVKFREVHHFYDQMCLACGDFNFAKRSQTADLRNRTAEIERMLKEDKP